MQTQTFTIINKVGLHARPAALFVQTAAKFKSTIMVKNITRNGSPVNAKSILSVMGLAVAENHQIEISIDGPDETDALQTLSNLINNNFAE